jgi:23S rRNA-/tRNA-specific pseudouridylate synthase
MVMPAVHRLDRLVSGLLILARNATRADLFRQEVFSVLLYLYYNYRYHAALNMLA